MSELYDALKAEIEHVKSDLGDVLADGKVSVGEVLPFLTALYGHWEHLQAAFVESVEKLGGDGPAKKRAVLDALGKFYDEVVAPLDVPGPDALIDPAIRHVLLLAADYGIDRAVALMNAQKK